MNSLLMSYRENRSTVDLAEQAVRWIHAVNKGQCYYVETRANFSFSFLLRSSETRELERRLQFLTEQQFAYFQQTGKPPATEVTFYHLKTEKGKAVAEKYIFPPMAKAPTPVC